MPIHVRVATSLDLETVLALMQFLHPEDTHPPDTASQSVFKEILESGNFMITLAEINDEVIGSCYTNVIPNLTRTAKPYAVIENVVTHPDFRRRGVGKALVTDALERAKAAGCYKVMLLTGGDADVQNFYRSCGMTSQSKTAFIRRW